MPSVVTHPIVESWQIHDRIHAYLLDAVPDAALGLTSASKGRTVAEQFAHIHNVRLMWLKSANAALLEGLVKLEKDGLSKADLRSQLGKSADAVGTLLSRALESDQKIKGFKPHATAFFAYLVSHESHHRGQIALTLKQAGYPLDKKTGFGLWEWGVR